MNSFIMQNYVLAFALLCVFQRGYGQYAQDSVAIVRLLEKEAASWRVGDLKAHADCWVIRPYSRILVSLTDGTALDVNPALMINPPANMAGKGGYATLSNFKMGIHRDNAWVSHEEVSTAADGKQHFSREMRMLERVKKQWKLVGQSAHMYLPNAPAVLARPPKDTIAR